MTPAARAQAAIEILDQVIASAIDNGPPADALVTAYFKTRRYAGSKDRRAVRELVFRAIRHAAKRPLHGRAALVGLADVDAEVAALFDGSPHGPAPIAADEPRAAAGTVPQWLHPHLSPLIGADEWPALLDRAPLDLRVHAQRGDRAALAAELEATLTPHSPWGLRLPPDTKLDDHPAVADGRIEVQDEGSQLIALACRPQDEQNILDLCAGAGGKALALAAAAPGARIVASDTVRSRLAQLAPRAARAGADIRTRLLDGGREAQGLADLADQADVVLVDAPCSGSGTWRRNPEGRWRLDAARLRQLVQLQARVLALGAGCVRPGGALVYAVCSILAEEGARQVEDFLSRRSAWRAEDPLPGIGRRDGAGRLLTPGHDGCDGFFVARLVREG